MGSLKTFWRNLISTVFKWANEACLIFLIYDTLFWKNLFCFILLFFCQMIEVRLWDLWMLVCWLKIKLLFFWWMGKAAILGIKWFSKVPKSWRSLTSKQNCVHILKKNLQFLIPMKFLWRSIFCVSEHIRDELLNCWLKGRAWKVKERSLKVSKEEGANLC